MLQGAYRSYDTSLSGSISPEDLFLAYCDAGILIDYQLHSLLVLRLRLGTKGAIRFDDFVESIVRLRCLFGEFQFWVRRNHATDQLNIVSNRRKPFFAGTYEEHISHKGSNIFTVEDVNILQHPSILLYNVQKFKC